MKRIVFLTLLSVMFCVRSAAQAEIDSVEYDGGEMVTTQQLDAKLGEITSLITEMKNMTLKGELPEPPASKDVYVSLPRRKFLKNVYIYPTLDVSPTVSSNKLKAENQVEDGAGNGRSDTESTDATGFGLDFGTSVIFVPASIENEQLRLNSVGFAFSLGAITSFARSHRYGTVCDFLLKLGVELGNGHRVGIGADALWGYGKGVGDVYMSKNIVDENEPVKVVPYTEWGWERGVQVWMKTNLFNTSIFAKTEMLIFARLVYTPNPEVMTEVSMVHHNVWKSEQWMFGITFRYGI